MPVHACRHSGSYILVEGVGRHGKNGDGVRVGVYRSANGSCRLIAIHDRHLHIHQNNVVLTGSRGRKKSYYLSSVFGTFDRGPCHFKKLLGDFTVEFIVFNQQYMLPRKVIMLMCSFRL